MGAGFLFKAARRRDFDRLWKTGGSPCAKIRGRWADFAVRCTVYERDARQHGWQRIAGLDEAGRGSLFGPVVAAAVILTPRRRIVGLDDFKKLTPDRRQELAPPLREHA